MSTTPEMARYDFQGTALGAAVAYRFNAAWCRRPRKGPSLDDAAATIEADARARWNTWAIP